MSNFLDFQSNCIIQSLKNGPLKVCVIGSGNWGTVAARIVANNVQSSYIFHDKVNMYVHEEIVEGRKLTEIINTDRENKKYLPNIELPKNIYATSNLSECIESMNLLIFVLPHQFLQNILNHILQYKHLLHPAVKAISLIKGMDIHKQSFLPFLPSQIIFNTLHIECSVLSGANVASEIAKEEFCETTIGYRCRESAIVFKELFRTKYFKINCLPDIYGIEVCGALKNIIALSAGFCDAIKNGTNTKSAILRIGFYEIKKFAFIFFDGILEETFLDSAGLADLITTCFGGRNVKCAAEFALHKGKKSWNEIEAEFLNGQKLQGTVTAKSVYEILKNNDLENLFPLFITTYKIAFENAPFTDIIDVFQNEEPESLPMLNEYNGCVMGSKILDAKKKVKKL